MEPDFLGDAEAAGRTFVLTEKGMGYVRRIMTLRYMGGMSADDIVERAVERYHEIKMGQDAFRDFKRSGLSKMLREQGGRCVFCRSLLKTAHATVEHMRPIVRGGAIGDISNYAISCGQCNSMKSDMTAEEFTELRAVMLETGIMQ